MDSMSSALRHEIDELVKALPEEELPALQRFVAFLASQSDPVLRSLRNAPMDDEPETDAEREAVAHARAQIARGEVFTTEEVLAELDL